MKKLILLTAAALFVTGASFADNGKKKDKKSNKSCCSKSGKTCKKKDSNTASL